MAKIAFSGKVMAKTTTCFHYGNLYNHRGLKVFPRQYMLAENSDLAKKAGFDLNIAIIAMTSNLSVATYLSLP